MLAFADWTRRRDVKPAAPPASAVPPLTPAAYLRLRRLAAGLTVEQVAARIADTPTDRDDAVHLVDMLETDGVRARYPFTLERLQRAFPFDRAVYRQLAETPPDQHPHVCRSCGCSQWDACVSADGSESCGWTTPHLCDRHDHEVRQ